MLIENHFKQTLLRRWRAARAGLHRRSGAMIRSDIEISAITYTEGGICK